MILLMSRDSIFQSTVGGMIWLMPALLSGGSPRRWALWDSTGMPCMQSTPNYMPFKFPDTYLIGPSPVTGHLCVGKNAPTPVNTWSVTWRKTCEIVVRHIHELSPQVFEFLNSLITLPLLVILKDAASIYLWKFRRAEHGIWEAAVTTFMDYRDERKKKPKNSCPKCEPKNFLAEPERACEWVPGLMPLLASEVWINSIQDLGNCGQDDIS